MESLTIPKEKVAAHYHNTYDRAIENLLISMHYGNSVIDSSVAGLGGCPYAKGASGNVPTEDVLLMAEILGIDTGINQKEVCKLGKYLIAKFDMEKRCSVEESDFDNMEYFRGLLL